MKIWVIGRNYPSPKNNLQGSFELEQAKMLGEQNNEVCYLCLVFHPFKKVRKRGYISWQEKGINICAYSQFYAFERMKIHWRSFQEKTWEKFLKKVEDQFGIPDIIHVHYPAMISEPEAILQYQKRGTRVIVTEHWSHVLTNALDTYERNRLCTYIEHANASICVGQPLKNSVLGITNTSKEVYVVPNVVSNRFYPASKIKSNDEYQFITVGRLQSYKQVDGIIQAFAERFAGIKGYKLIVIGDGAELPNLKKLAKQLNVEKQVVFTGTLARPDVATYVANADCLVCFSKSETFGVPVIEAWACGIPVLASDSLGFTEYFNDSLGYIVSKNSISDLSSAMEKIVQNRNNYSKEHIANFANENFGEEAVYQRLLKLYSSNE